MLKTFIISFLVLLLVAGIALLAWTIVDAHQRQHNNRPRSKYWFARSMAASIGIIVPTRLVLSTPAFVTLLSLTIATLFVLRWWMHAGPLPYRKEPLAYFSLTLLALLIAATFAFIRPVDVVASAIAAIFFAGTAGASMLLKTGFLMGHTPQRKSVNQERPAIPVKARSYLPVRIVARFPAWRLIATRHSIVVP